MTLLVVDHVAGWLAHPGSILPPEGVRTVRSVIDGTSVFFCIRDASDRIQRRQSRGKFYEPEELELIRAHFPKGGVFCDIGANIGNHSIFALAFLGAGSAIVFEPNPAAYELLVLNVIYNGFLDRVDLRHLGKGVSDRDAGDLGLVSADSNLGATRLVPGTGAVPVARGDQMLAGQQVHFIKLDVEGMEIDALHGLGDTVRTHQPPILLEVSHQNRPALDAWMAQHGYAIAEQGRQFRHNGNLLLLPKPH